MITVKIEMTAYIVIAVNIDAMTSQKYFLL
jgi:hypothetical protein